MDTIRWGILSTGSIAHSFVKDLKLIPDAELVAVGSRSQSTADSFGDMHDIPNRHSSYEALANDPDVDVIYVATPHTIHLENSILCMKAGKAVLCEKALTINAREAEEMIRVAREEKVFLMEAMVTRHFPVTHQILDWINEGKIGEVRMVKATRGARGKFDNFTRHLNPELGGGSLLDVGIYVISFASMIYGKAPLKSVGYGYIGSSGSDEQGAALLEYDAGALAILTYALRTETVNEAYIFGTEGYIKVFPTFAVAQKAVLHIEGEEEVITEIPINGNGLNYEAREVMRCLRAGELESPRMPLDESLEIMRIMDNIRAPWPLKYPNDE
jgi:dihydrodiol dehydrogenase / D-xylose 1-dehydrogenase (NADP)